MKTLSNDLTIKLPTTGMPEGFVLTKIYANSIGVFTGNSYIPGNNSSLYVNINDIASQNRGKDDYLKLNDDGVLQSVSMKYGNVDSLSYSYRFNRGQVGNYKVQISKDTSVYDDTLEVLTGYDYENKDLRPRFIYQYDSNTIRNSSLCRIMSGSNWIWEPSSSYTNFKDVLLPHYPYISTSKYGIGLQLWREGDNQDQSYIDAAFAIRLSTGQQFNLGTPIYVSSNMTFTTLDNFLDFVRGNIDYNSNIYLKLTDSNDDEFGELVPAHTDYKRQEVLSSLTVYAEKGEARRTTTILPSNEKFSSYAQRYIEVTSADWNITDIISGENVVYDSGWQGSATIAGNFGDDYKETYGAEEVPLTWQETLSGFTLVRITPNYTDNNLTRTIPVDIYYGRCAVGVLDKCYSRYYLAWNDRYGDIQSQAFDGKIEYSENIDTEEIMDYKLRRRVSHKEVQPKWKLNTKWLNQDIYPIYESIYTSPYLLLYDTEQDKSWNVIVTNSDYKEKTFKTEKGLFNLEITVEANKTQNMTY